MASAWGTSWGTNWLNSWAAGVVAPAVSTSAGRSYGTQYRAKTISRELRDREREAKRAQRRLARAVVAKVRQLDWFDDPEIARQTRKYIEAEASRFVPQFDDTSAVQAAIARLIAGAEAQANIIWQEMQDEEFLLLAN